MKTTEKTLIESMGFSPKKAKVYLALLELGETEVANIAKKAGLKRTTVYNILPELAADGLISMTLQRGKKVFFIDTPKKLETSLLEKQKDLLAILPDLTSLQSTFFSRPRITVHEGISGVKEIYRDFIESCSPGDTVYAAAGTKNFDKYFPEGFLDEYAEKRIAKNIRLKLIVNKSDLTEKLQSLNSVSLREIKIADSKEFELSVEMVLYGNKVAFISYTENFLGVIVESKEISAIQRAMFNLLWNRI